MAGINFPKTSYGETTTIKRSIVDQIELVSPRATPVLKRLSPGLNNLSEPCEEVKYEWVEDELSLTASTLAASMSTSESPITVASGHGEFFLLGHILLIDDEKFIVTTKGTTADAVAVSPGWGGTTATSHAASSVVTIIGRAAVEGADAPDDSYTVPTIPYNYCQNFVAEVALTDIEAAVKRWGVRDQWAYQEGKKLTETMKLVELGVFHSYPVLFAASTAGAMGGLENYIYASNKNSISSAAVKEDDLNDLLQEIFGLVGEEFMPNLIICNAWVRRKINSWYAPYARTERAESVGGVVIDRIQTLWGEMEVLLSLNCPASKMYVLNTNMIGLGPLAGEAFHVMEIARTGTAEKRLLSGVYTMEMRNPKCHGMIYGISTSS